MSHRHLSDLAGNSIIPSLIHSSILGLALQVAKRIEALMEGEGEGGKARGDGHGGQISFG